MKLSNPFKRADKFLMQLSVDLGGGLNGGMSVNLPLDTDIHSMHRVMDLMRRVQDRQRAITELPVFEQKLEILEAQLDSTRKTIVEYTEIAEKEEQEFGAPKTATGNVLQNNQQNLERMEADYKIGKMRVENIKRRAEVSEQDADDIRELNKLSVAA